MHATSQWIGCVFDALLNAAVQNVNGNSRVSRIA